MIPILLNVNIDSRYSIAVSKAFLSPLEQMLFF